MSKSFEVQGLIHSIGETTEYGNNGFTKREFVIKLTGEGENSAYPNHVALELIKDKCAQMDSYSIGDEITAHFNLSGRLWSGNGKPDGIGSGADVSDQTPPLAAYENQGSAVSNSFDDEIPF